MSSSDKNTAKVIRLSLRELDKDCNAQKRNDFLKAWKLIQELPPTNPNSFWSIATYHGMPFKERRAEDEDLQKTWGGYCQHGNVLFPFWHRFYCLRLEQALQSVLEGGTERVALHYWDESSKESKSEAAPTIVTAEYVHIDGDYVPNPLLKYTLPLPIGDDVSTTDENSQFYEKEAGYETCRYPYSGIRSPKDAMEAALAHNCRVNERDETTKSLFQANIIGWLMKGGKNSAGVVEQFKSCLDTARYNPFSNTTSAGFADVSLEQPHNGLHLAIGGFTQPETNEDGSVKRDAQGKINWDSPIEGANGDMGANEVASYDPIFFLHHANIDRMLWVWQKKHKKTDPSTFTIDNSDDKDKGISNSNQGATPNQTWGQKLNENTILYPFQDEYGVPRTSKDCINIVSQLHYDYSIGSLDQPSWPEPDEETTKSLLDKPKTPWKKIVAITKTLKMEKLRPTIQHREATVPPRHRLRILFDRTRFTPTVVSSMEAIAFPTVATTDPIIGDDFKLNYFVQVKDINKDKISGSFVVQVFYSAAGKLYYLGQRGVLSRWNRRNCANCQGRKMAHVSIPIGEGDDAPYDPQNLQVHLVSKDGMTGKYIRKIFDGKDLVKSDDPQNLQVYLVSKDVMTGKYIRKIFDGKDLVKSDEQKPSLRIVGALLQK